MSSFSRMHLQQGAHGQAKRATHTNQEIFRALEGFLHDTGSSPGCLSSDVYNAYMKTRGQDVPDSTGSHGAERQATAPDERTAKWHRSETHHNQEASRKGAEVYQRISTWDRRTLPLEAPAPGQPRMRFYGVYSAMCPKGRGAGMTGSTTAGYPVPVDKKANIRVFHIRPIYLCPECSKRGRKHNPRLCGARPRRFKVTIPGYTDKGRRMREKAAAQQKGSCKWMAAFPKGWKVKALKNNKKKYAECAGRRFWVNHNDLALFEEISE